MICALLLKLVKFCTQLSLLEAAELSPTSLAYMLPPVGEEDEDERMIPSLELGDLGFPSSDNWHIPYLQPPENSSFRML